VTRRGEALVQAQRMGSFRWQGVGGQTGAPSAGPRPALCCCGLGAPGETGAGGDQGRLSSHLCGRLGRVSDWSWGVFGMVPVSARGRGLHTHRAY